jgi:hypothetical protein
MDRTIFDPIDAYCERLGPGLWAEPVNALTNLAFILAAVAAASRLGRPAPPLGLALAVILGAIGVGSGLFHTFANPLTALLDVGAIAAFVLVYIYAVNRHVLGWPAMAAALGLLAFVACPTTTCRRWRASCRILTFMEQLNEVDVEGVEPMTSVTPMRLKRRADVVTDGGMQAKVLSNAPDAREGFFAVPKVVE